MTGVPASAPAGPRRRRSRLLWVAVACGLAVVVEVAVFTNAFGLIVAKSSSGGTPVGPPPGPNPNPYNESITGVNTTITYYEKNATGYFPALEGKQLCPACPERPKTNYNYTPPAAGFWFYVNVTNTGNTDEELSNFSLTTSGPNAALFVLVVVLCCYPLYGEETYALSFLSGATWSLAAYVIAAAIPDDGTTGYALTFSAVSP